MSDDDFMKDILAEAESPSAMNAHSRALDAIKKFNLPARFTILVDKPIPAFTGNFARAFEVNDQKQKEDIYALILPSSIPIRFQTITQLKNAFNHSFSNIIESGLTDAAGGQFGNYAVVLEKPRGKKLSEILKEAKITQKEEGTQNKKEYKSLLDEDFIEKEIVAPLNEVLKTLAENNISHGRINHDNVYLQGVEEGKVTLGECISEPCGYSQPHQYETIERAQAMPLGKGNCSPRHDYFALGVLVYYCMFGEVPGATVEYNDLLRARINKGTYNVYMGTQELSPRSTDILRGLLTDNHAERWGYEQVSNWLKGKRFNLIRPNVRKEAVRNYEFADGLFSNKRSLALAYYQKWDDAAFDMRDKKLAKWLELSAADKNTASEITSAVAATGGEKTKSRHDNDELVARTLIILDNEAPLRFREICVHLDGMGAVLANAWAHQSQSELQHFVDIIRMNLPDFKITHETESEKVDRWTLQRQQTYIKFKSLGFGIERVLYDLNPTLPCQSPMLVNQFVIDCSQLLFFLNDNATKLSGNDPVDRHIAAFIASKMELASEVRLKIMTRFGRNENALLQITKLAMLAFAQKKTKVSKLPGLGNWMVEKLKVVVNSIHSRKIRKELQEELKNVANQGSLEALLAVITNADYFARDDEGFADAKYRYATYDADLKAIRAREKMGMTHNSNYLYGLQFSKIFAALVFIATLALVVSW